MAKVKTQEVFKSMDEFLKRYFPDEFKRCPITMRVTEEEQRLILGYRGKIY